MDNCVIHDFEYSFFLYKNIRYEKNKCSKCGFISTRPEMGEIDYEVYDSGHYKLKKNKLIPFLINLFDYLYIFLLLKFKGFKRNSYLLDFGCGKGYFLYMLKILRSKNLYGVETSQPRATFAAQLTKVPISNEFYSSGLIFGKPFDFVTLIHVLEHIPNYTIFLDTLTRDAITEKGKIFIEVPNINSIASLIAKENWAHFTPHFHTNHFTAKALEGYCISRGYDYTVLGTFSFYNSAMGMTSAFLSLFGYGNNLFEELKKRNLFTILVFLILLPISLMAEFVIALFTRRGSVIKIVISK